MRRQVVRSISTNNFFEIVVITAEGSVKAEATTCNALFEAGLSKLHVRKPGASAVQVKSLIQAISPHYRNKIVVHEHHELVEEMNLGGYHIKSRGNAPDKVQDKHVSKSFHTFEAIQSCRLNLQYGFLSPIFDSLSKPGYSSRFAMESLKVFLASKLRFSVYALGGITRENVANAKSLGFQGVAVLGSIWQKNSLSERLTAYESLKNQI